MPQPQLVVLVVGFDLIPFFTFFFFFIPLVFDLQVIGA